MVDSSNVYKQCSINGVFFNVNIQRKNGSHLSGRYWVHDLWKFDVTDLDAMYKELTRRRNKTDGGESLLEQRSESDTLLDLQIAVLKDIIETKLAIAKANEDRMKAHDEIRKLEELIQRKKDDTLGNASIEELEKQLADKRAVLTNA